MRLLPRRNHDDASLPRLEVVLVVKVPEDDRVDPGGEMLPGVLPHLLDREIALHPRVRPAHPALDRFGDGEPARLRDRGEDGPDRVGARDAAPEAVLAVAAVHEIAMGGPHPAPRPRLEQPLVRDRIEGRAEMTPADAIVPVPLEVVDLHPRAPHAPELLDDRAMVSELET